MSDLQKTITCLLALALSVAFSFGGYTLTSNRVVVPIEVLGSDGHTETITVTANDVSNVDRIWFYTYSQGDPLTRDLTPKAEISINGGPWISVTNDNSNISCMSPEDVYGCVEGVYWSTRWTLDVSGANVALNNGENTITFRHNLDSGSLGTGAANVSSGYYVLGLAFLNAGDPLPRARAFTPDGSPGGDPNDWMAIGAIDGTTFTWWDPMNDANFGIPDGMNNSTDISAGESLWHARNKLVEGPGSGQIEASCADCHAADGSDLQAFAFSNKSIVARSNFHGLTDKEGRQIAAYIRSSHSRSDIVAKGPWQPPYQSGPEISSFNPDCAGLHPDNAPDKCWTAGSGMEWVLEKDAQMKQYLFPNGTAGQAGLDVASTLNTINTRDMPVALVFPDWNEWLPRTHPLDATHWSRSDFVNHSLYTDYADGVVEDAWLIAESDPENKGWKATNRMEYWGAAARKFRRSFIDKYDAPDNEKLGMTQWKAVKAWEVMRGREALAPRIYNVDIVDVNGSVIKSIPGEDRSWVGADRSIFNVAPHINKGKIYGPDNSIEDQYMDTAWYELQMVINAGNRDAIVIRPMDWKYHLQHISGIERSASDEGFDGYSHSYRYARSLMKQNQQLDTGDAPEDEAQGLGDWHWRHTSHRWLADRRSAFGQKIPLDDLPASERGEVVTAILRAYMDRIERVPVNSDGYDCSTSGGNCLWERSTNNNDLEAVDTVPSTDGFMDDSNYIEHFYEATGWMGELGAEPRVLGRMYDWAAVMWPKGNDTNAMGSNPTWDSLNPCREPNKTSECTSDPTTTPTSDTQNISLQAGWNLISSHIAPDDATLESIFESVSGDLVLAKNESGETFVPSYSINTIGSWSTSEAYMVYMTSAQELTISGSSFDPSTGINLDEGWNLVPFYPSSSMPVEDAFADLGSTLVVVKDYAGNAYIPEYNINEIGSLEPGEGYKVYVTNATTHSFPSSKAGVLASKSAGNEKGVSASATVVLQTPGLDEGTTILARTTSGEVVGRGVVRRGKAAVNIAGDDPLTSNVVEGADDGAEIKLVRTDGQEETAISYDGYTEVIGGKSSSGPLVYTKEALFVADVTDQNLSFKLLGNAPNPTRDRTSITFSVPETAPVRIELYNLLGQRVATLVDDSYPAGAHTVNVDASTLSSGTYFYRMEAGAFRESRKMTVVR